MPKPGGMEHSARKIPEPPGTIGCELTASSSGAGKCRPHHANRESVELSNLEGPVSVVNQQSADELRSKLIEEGAKDDDNREKLQGLSTLAEAVDMRLVLAYSDLRVVTTEWEQIKRALLQLWDDVFVHTV